MATDTIEAELVVRAIAEGFDKLGDVITEQAEAQRKLEKETRDAAAAAREQEKAQRELEKAQRHAQEEMKKWGEAGKLAFEIIGKGLDYATKASERLGRTDMPDALDAAESAVQRLGDTLLTLPIGKINPVFQAFGDTSLKNADALTILTKGLRGAADGANILTAAWIKYQAETGQITWEEAAKQVDALTQSVEDNTAAVGVGTSAVETYAMRMEGLGKTFSNTAQNNINKWLEAREAEAGAANLALMAQVAQTLAAGLSGDLGNAQKTYNETVADSNERIADLQDKIAGLNTWSRDYKTTVDELNGAIAEQNQRQLEAAEALKLANAQFVFQQAAASLDEQGQLALAFSLGLIDEASYNASLKVIALTEAYDENNNGIIDVNENQENYINGLTNLANGVNNNVLPSLKDQKQALWDAEKAMGSATVEAGKYNDTIAEIPDKKGTVIEVTYSTTNAPPPAVTPIPAGRNSGQGFAAGADFVVPPGYPNDSFPMRVQSGERVIVQTPAQQAAGDGGGISIGNVTINAAPGMDGAALWQEFKAAAGAEVRAQRAAGYR